MSIEAPIGLELVRGRRAQGVLAALSLQNHRGITTDALVELVWPAPDRPPTAKMSLSNIVSRLRSRYHRELIEFTGSGYRLGITVISDRARFVAEVSEAGHFLADDPARALGLVDQALDRWRGDPWTGLDDRLDAVGDRSHLHTVHRLARRTRARALVGLGRGFEAIRLLEELVADDPHHEQTWIELSRAQAASGQRIEGLRTLDRARRALAQIGIAPGPPLTQVEQELLGADTPTATPSARLTMPAPVTSSALAALQAEALHQCSSHWLAGDVAGALDVIDASGHRFDPGLARRLARCVTEIPSWEPLSRVLWAETVLDRMTDPEQSLRALLSNDARALELRGRAGLEVADREVDEAASQDELVQALRVRLMVGLGYPLEDRQAKAVDRLAELDDPGAQVEAARFAAVLEVKAGDRGKAIELLHRYAAVVRQHWPDAHDDFADMAFHVLGAQASEGTSPAALPVRATYPAFRASPNAAKVANAWYGILPTSVPSPPDARSAPLPYGFHEAIGAVTADLAQAIVLRHHLRTGNELAAASAAAALRPALAGKPADRYHHGALAALGQFAIETSDRALAGEVSQALLPWSDEVLGLWPFDAIIGPARDLLAALETVAS